MEKFYAGLGWVIVATLLVSTFIAYRAPSVDQAIAILWVAQVPLYAYITVGIILLYKTAARRPPKD
jgi:hypothetical protein